MADQIPERIFKIAADNGGVPFSFREDDSELVIVLVDGRKLVLEKELGTRKRIQQAEAEQAEAAFKQAEKDYNEALVFASSALTAMTKAEAKAKDLRAIADGKVTPVLPAQEHKKAGKK
jgi:VIT1/CCC1 family predicted Fe2+/Mn2+ transporter